jgi:hypothetical protein
VTACACERTGEVNLPQVLHLIGGNATTGKVYDPTCWLTKALEDEKDDDKLMDAIFLRTLSRLPKDEERTKVNELLKTHPRDELLRDLLWAVLNSKEFLFNY